MSDRSAQTDGSQTRRLSTGVPGLDEILHGGLLRGGLYIVQGRPGTGKTILANQMMYHHARGGERALFITLLGENHARMMAHLQPMTFFDIGLVPQHVAYLSAYQELEQGELKGLLEMIRREAQGRGASLLVLDGLTAVQTRTGSPYAMKRFAHELQTLASALDCTMLLITTRVDGDAPERTMVDGIIELRQRLYGVRNERRVQVDKFRGSGIIEGEHSYRITSAGLRIFPRVEALLGTSEHDDRLPQTRVSSGIPALDQMFGEGIPAGSVLALVGPPGSGKTTLGLQFLSRASGSEPGLVFGCYETPERLRLKAKSLQFDLAVSEQRGEMTVLWSPLGEHIIDELALRLLKHVRQRRIRRLFIDGLSGFQNAMVEPERFLRFWSILSNELRSLGVTTMYTLEMPDIVGPSLGVPVSGISSLAEGMIVLRYLELDSRLHRLISIIKVREGAADPTIRRFTISNAGIVIGEAFQGVEALLSGMARPSLASGRVLITPTGSGGAGSVG